MRQPASLHFDPALIPTTARPSVEAVPMTSHEQSTEQQTGTMKINDFQACLQNHFARSPPVAVMKYSNTRDPRYFLVVPNKEVLPQSPNITVTVGQKSTLFLYRIKVTGEGRRGLYPYIQRANEAMKKRAKPAFRKKFAWLTDPDDNEWQLMREKLSRYIRTDIIGQFHVEFDQTS